MCWNSIIYLNFFIHFFLHWNGVRSARLGAFVGSRRSARVQIAVAPDPQMDDPSLQPIQGIVYI